MRVKANLTGRLHATCHANQAELLFFYSASQFEGSDGIAGEEASPNCFCEDLEKLSHHL